MPGARDRSNVLATCGSFPSGAIMKKFFFVFILATLACTFLSQTAVAQAVASQAAPSKTGKNTETARWDSEAAHVTIIRDDWGIAHVYGKTDADAVFGMIYAQAEDDFNRVETNYINGMGRLAEAEGEGKIYQDLRMKLFIRPEALRKEYAASPDWLKKLM